MGKWVPVAKATTILGISERSLRYRISKSTIESKLEGGRRFVLVEEDITPHEDLHAISQTFDYLKLYPQLSHVNVEFGFDLLHSGHVHCWGVALPPDAKST